MQVLEENGDKKARRMSARTPELLARRRPCLLQCRMADRQTARPTPASATLPRGCSRMRSEEAGQADGRLDRGECEERLGSLAEEAVP